MRNKNFILSWIPCLLALGALLIPATRGFAGISSGLTAVSSNGSDSPVSLCSSTSASFTAVIIENEGGVGGFYSVDGGGTWMRLEYVTGGVAETYYPLPSPGPVNVMVKRTPGGPDITGIYGSAR